MARIAMIVARWPGPPMTGRKTVIRTAIAALAAEGHAVDLLVLTRREPDGALPGVRAIVWLGLPSPAAAMRNAALSLLRGEDSVNEALFRSAACLARVRACRGRYDFAVADTIRAAPYASALGVPWHLDLDDLFSARYEKYLSQAEGPTAAHVLGYYRESAPRFAGALPAGIVRRVLAREAACLKRREAYWSGRASSASLVSPDEAATFSRVVGRTVRSLPMSVPVPAAPWTCDGGQKGGAFLGALDYKPNMDALLYYQREVHPQLRAAGRLPPLAHIGHAPPELRARFSPDVVRFEGYADDVAARLRRAEFFVAPVVSGSGIKTKVLEAMAVGLPVLATPEAVAGLNVEHAKHCFVCERPARFAEGVAYVREPRAAEAMGREARRYVQENFSMEVLGRRWHQVLESLAREAACCRT